MTTQTPADILPMLRTWQRNLADVDKQLDALAAIVGDRAESPLTDAVHSLQAAYTAAVSELVGDRDAWLDWYRWENDMGARGHLARSGKWKAVRRIRTLKNLAALIKA